MKSINKYLIVKNDNINKQSFEKKRTNLMYF